MPAFTTEDGLKLVVRSWKPDSTTSTQSSVVVIVHGYAEHCGRYAPLAANFATAGHIVFGYDQRGFGLSEGPRAYTSSFDAYLDDLGLFLSYVRGKYPDYPLFLFGHSMGGAVVALYGIERDVSAHDVSGAVLSSPALKTNEAPLLQKLSALMGRLLPHLRTIPLNIEFLSQDTSVIEAVRTDPLYYHGRILARTGAEILRAMQRIQDGAHRFTLPFLVFHGTADHLTDPDGSRSFHNHAGSDDKTLRLFDGLYHETFNEPEKDNVRGLILSWLKTHLPG